MEKAEPVPETAAGVKEEETSVSGKPRELEKEEVLNNINTLLLNDDEVATTLEAARKKLAAAHAREKKKQKSRLAKFLSALSPKRILVRFRDCYVNTCMYAVRGDFGNMAAGHPGMFYASENTMSRNSSHKWERDHEELLASLSRQFSGPLSREASLTNSRGSSPAFNRTTSMGLNRNASTGIAGMNSPSRLSSVTGIADLNRLDSTGIPSLSRQASSEMNGTRYGRNSSPRRFVPDSELYKAGRSTFLETVAVRNSSSPLRGSPARHSLQK